MSCRALSAILGALALFGATVACALSGEGRVALLPIQDRAGDTEAAATTLWVLHDVLSQQGDLVDPARIRDTARRLRMRNPETADPEDLRQVGQELGADWIVSTTIHEAVRGEVPRLTISSRIIESETARLYWTGFAGGSGLDNRGLLEIGVVYELEELAEIVTRRLFEDLYLDPSTTTAQLEAFEGTESHLGRVAIVPFAGLARSQATVSAEAVTEAVRSTAHRRAVNLLPANQVSQILREGLVTWGEIDAESRETLHRSLGADTILTGTVEAYEVGGGAEPRPRVMIAVRLVDARSGKILWADGLERDGWYRQRLFRRGRIYSGGTLTKKVTDSLLQRVLTETTSRKTG